MLTILWLLLWKDILISILTKQKFVNIFWQELTKMVYNTLNCTCCNNRVILHAVSKLIRCIQNKPTRFDAILVWHNPQGSTPSSQSFLILPRNSRQPLLVRHEILRLLQRTVLPHCLQCTDTQLYIAVLSNHQWKSLPTKMKRKE